MPKSRLDFWKPKLEGNRARDLRSEAAMSEAGWSLIIVWECEVARPGFLADLAQRVKAMPARR